MSLADKRPVIGITLGDAAGIGPEVAAAALASGKLDPGYMYRCIGHLPLDVTPGQPTPETAQAAWAALEEAARLALAGELAAVVTGPVCKANLYAEGFHFPGQTEFFAARCGVENFAMLLTGGKLTVALVSTHLPLASAVRQLSAAEIVRVGGLLADFLRLRLPRPARIAVAGLNPHAGENGTLGREEIDVIAPALQELQRGHAGAGVEFAGPVSPDTVFYQAAQGEWDAVLCMYHDQGLIPLKLHAFDAGVNVTLGLPIIRTSPDHGTAFGLAGKGGANAGSMIAAIHLATELAALRGTAGSGMPRAGRACADRVA
jgi:4-hydroxythreonine-4-phosphate dehydrogenase